MTEEGQHHPHKVAVSLGEEEAVVALVPDRQRLNVSTIHGEKVEEVQVPAGVPCKSLVNATISWVSKHDLNSVLDRGLGLFPRGRRHGLGRKGGRSQQDVLSRCGFVTPPELRNDACRVATSPLAL